tara:strand:- start:1292 stop:1675 length:384 start_codon:yes stop_codon:yes gene_type:complete
MANHIVTTEWTKSGSVFNTIAEALEQHLADIGGSETTIAEHETSVAAQTDFTETRTLASNGSTVASGTAGNGYNLVRTWTEAKYKADIDANGWDDISGLETGGWNSITKDINPDTGVAHAQDWYDPA